MESESELWRHAMDVLKKARVRLDVTGDPSHQATIDEIDRVLTLSDHTAVNIERLENFVDQHADCCHYCTRELNRD